MIADAYDTVFKDGDLTQLMITKKGDRSQIPKRLSYPLYKLLHSFLANYEIYSGGATYIGDYEVIAVTIRSSFHLKNELVLRELYSFTEGEVNIQLSTPLANNCAWAFNYNLTDYSCTLEKYVYGSTEESTRYDSLEAMLTALSERENAESED